MLNPLIITQAVQSALMEDLGRAGDLTSQALIPASARAIASMVSRKHGVLAGVDLAVATFRMLDPNAVIHVLKQDSDTLNAGDTLLTVEGAAQAVLSAERVALNYVSHLSGIASTTAELVKAVAHTKAKITCTRKTTPGLRALEKHAVSCGGGSNHRFGLDDAVLIKDNHIAVMGNIKDTLRAAKASIGHLVKVEIEVDTLEQLDQVLEEGADCVLLDNMDLPTLKEAVRRINGQMLAEASGNVRLETVAGIAQTGVDLIAVGWITHSAPTLDIGLDIRL